MLTKAAFLTGAAVGYVLGARAGRERYEQIARTARRTWEDPRVQERVGDVQERVTQAAADTGQALQDKVAGATGGGTAQGEQGTAPEGGDTVVLTTYDSATGTMETTTVDLGEQAGSNGRPG